MRASQCDLVFVDEVITEIVSCLCIAVCIALLNAASTATANLHLSQLVCRAMR